MRTISIHLFYITPAASEPYLRLCRCNSVARPRQQAPILSRRPRLDMLLPSYSCPCHPTWLSCSARVELWKAKMLTCLSRKVSWTFPPRPPSGYASQWYSPNTLFSLPFLPPFISTRHTSPHFSSFLPCCYLLFYHPHNLAHSSSRSNSLTHNSRACVGRKDDHTTPSSHGSQSARRIGRDGRDNLRMARWCVSGTSRSRSGSSVCCTLLLCVWYQRREDGRVGCEVVDKLKVTVKKNGCCCGVCVFLVLLKKVVMI